MARRGARSIELPDRPRVPGEAGTPSRPPPPRRQDRWERQEDAAGTRRPEKPEPARSRRRRGGLAPDVSDDINRQVRGQGAEVVGRRMAEAADAFRRDRIADAVRILRPLARDQPGIAAVRELAGLSLYRAGRWAEAARHLEAAQALSGSIDQVPVLADCYRALKRYPQVDGLWADLRDASPEPAILTEGRIVAAGSLADRGRLREAIEMLEVTARKPKGRRARISSPAIWDVRAWYALADLYERVGDSARARELFVRVMAAEPDLADVAERLSALA